MIRGLLTGIAALALTTGTALAQDTTYTNSDGDTVVVHHNGYNYRDDGTRVESRTVVHQHNPGAHALGGGVAGAGLGAAIGCLVTIPIGCAPGAAVGAAVGGGTGAVVGAATTPPDRVYHERTVDAPPPQ
jgi:hypothetical protein